MKKKIGDFTLSEVKNIKDKCKNYKSCKECKKTNPACHYLCSLLISVSQEDLEIEVEMEN